MLNIRIHRADGKIGRYSQPDAGAAERVLHRLSAERVFASRAIAIGVKNPFNLINTEHVCWVEVETDHSVSYTLPPGFERVTRLADRAEYEALLARQWPRWRTTFTDNEQRFLEALVEISLVDGSELYLHAIGRSPMSLDTLLETEHAIVATFASHGTLFINPRNIVRARIYHSEQKVNYPNGLWFAESDDI